MSQTTTPTAEKLAPDEALERFRRFQAEIARATEDLSDEEREALADRLTREVNAALAAHVRRSRGESG